LKKVLVTGASGFMGIPVLNFLKQENAEIHVVTLKELKGSSIDLYNGISVQEHFADLLDLHDIGILLDEVKPEFFLHLAWETQHIACLQSINNLRWLAAGQHMLIKFLENGGKRFVSVGTCFEYNLSQAFLPETSLQESESLYGLSKNCFYKTAAKFCREYGISYACARPFYLFGPNDKSGKAVAYAIGNFLRGEEVVYNTGAAVRDYMYINDCAEALVKLLFSHIEDAVNIASGKPVLMEELFKKIAILTGCETLLTVKNDADKYPVVLADVTRMKNELLYTPRHSLDDGLQKTLEWYRGNQN